MAAKIAVPLAALALAGVTACASSYSPPPEPAFIPVPQAARAYMEVHPVPPVPGMITGIVTAFPVYFTWSCPQNPRGDPFPCDSWAATLLTASGHTVTFTCGQAVSVPCSSAVLRYGERGYVPVPGDYIYVPAALHVTGKHDVRIIRPSVLDVTEQGIPSGCEADGWASIPACEDAGSS